MEVRVTPAIEQIIPPQISFNFEEIRAELAQKLQVYQNMVVTESGVKEAKADRANLNKFKAALADSRKSVKSQWNQPLSDFEDKMKVLEQMVDEPISVIDRQIKSFEEIKKNRHVVVTNNEIGDQKSYLIPFGSRITVKEGQEIKAGTRITEGSVNPHDVLAISGTQAVQDYLIQEVQRVYRMQGVDINDKHIEVIVRQMMKKVRIDEAGDTSLLPSSLVDKSEMEAENRAIRERIEAGETELREATYTPVLLGITKASLATDSFLSAASFQETTKVLTDAAIKGKVDPLIGLKENVIIGKLIPAGTGMKRYRNIKLHSDLVDSLEPPEPVEEAVEVVEEEKEKEVKILVKDPDVELDIAEDEEIAMTEADDDVVTIEE